MALSNYPPGVTGREPQIAGDDDRRADTPCQPDKYGSCWVCGDIHADILDAAQNEPEGGE